MRKTNVHKCVLCILLILGTQTVRLPQRTDTDYIILQKERVRRIRAVVRKKKDWEKFVHILSTIKT